MKRALVALLLACESVEPGALARLDKRPPDAPAPTTIASIDPPGGPTTGGTTVTIRGTGFTAGMRVTVGEVKCGEVVVASATELTCVTGARAPRDERVEVVVATARAAAAFAYACPFVTSRGRRSCGAAPPAERLPVPRVRAEAPLDLVVATAGDGAPVVDARAIDPLDLRGALPSVRIQLDGTAHAQTLQLTLASDATFANAYRFAFHSTQAQPWRTEGDLVEFTMSWSPANVTVIGAPDRGAITAVQLRVVDDASGIPVTAKLANLAAVPEAARGIVSIAFDDNFASSVTEGLPRLAAHGFPATAYVITDLVDDPGRATLAQLHALHAAGWEIAAHSMIDDHHAQRWPNVPVDVLEDDLVDQRAWLIDHGFDGYDHCAYPGGEITRGATDVLALVGRYFATCRTIFQGERESYPPSDARKLRVFYVTNQTTLASAQTAVTQARAHREWIIIVFHKLVTTPMVSTEWGIADFAELVEHIAASGLPVVPVGRVR